MNIPKPSNIKVSKHAPIEMPIKRSKPRRPAGTLSNHPGLIALRNSLPNKEDKR